METIESIHFNNEERHRKLLCRFIAGSSGGHPMSLINTEIKPFKATAYHNGKFIPVTDEALKGQ
jgi:hypothetical protein